MASDDIERAEAGGLTFAYPAGDHTIGRCLRDYGEFSSVASAFLRRVAGNGSVIDVGANIGTIALPVAQRARRVLAIEAHERLADLLQENAATNALFNVEVIHAAAGEYDGIAQFPTAPLNGNMNYGGIGFGSDFPLRPVRMVTLDAISPKDVTAIKIDVEGYELRVLEGAQYLLAQTRPIWLIESPDTHDARRVIETMQTADYRLYWFFVPFFTPNSPRRGPADRIRGDMNVVAVSREQPQPVGMPPVSTPRPTNLNEFPYLRAFGFAAASELEAGR